MKGDLANEFTELNNNFLSKVSIPRTKVGTQQEIEMLITEEALLFAKYLRNERKGGCQELVVWLSQEILTNSSQETLTNTLLLKSILRDRYE